MAGFSNPITGGQGQLDIPQIKSPNYVPGVSGWEIKRDGSAEFNNLSFRGTFRGTEIVIDGTGFYLYTGVPGLGNPPIVYITSAAVDPFGNALTATVGISGNTDILQFFDPFDPTIFTTVTDGFFQRIIASALAVEIELGRGNTASVNQARITALSNFALLDAIVNITAQFNSGIAPQMTLSQGMIVNASNNSPGGGAATEVWHDLRPLSNSFVGTVTNEYPPQFRVTADGELELHGAVQLPAAGSYNGITWATLPAGYRIAKFASLPVAQVSGAMSTDTTTSGSPRLYTDSTGVLQFFGISPSLNSTVIRFNGRIPMNSLPILV